MRTSIRSTSEPLTGSAGLRHESARIQSVAGGRIETITIRNADGSIASVTSREIRTFPWGEETTREVLDPDGAAILDHHPPPAVVGQGAWGLRHFSLVREARAGRAFGVAAFC